MPVQQPQNMGAGVTYASNDLLMGLCCSLSILSALGGSVPETMLRTMLLTPLVKLLNRAAREVCATQQNAQMHQQHYTAQARFNQ
jgi:hypothetical protein